VAVGTIVGQGGSLIALTLLVERQEGHPAFKKIPFQQSPVVFLTVALGI